MTAHLSARLVRPHHLLFTVVKQLHNKLHFDDATNTPRLSRMTVSNGMMHQAKQSGKRKVTRRVV